MSAIAYTRFDPQATLQIRNPKEIVAKAAKAATCSPACATTFARFATFAAEPDLDQIPGITSEHWAETHEERAGIIEYDGLAPRASAESLARLDPARPPGDISPRRWLRFINDCGHFLDNGWAVRAAELGWTAFDLFGCDRFKPFARIGRCGLLWLLDGGQLRFLTADRAVINKANGASTTFYRGPHEPDQVLAWEFAP